MTNQPPDLPGERPENVARQQGEEQASSRPPDWPSAPPPLPPPLPPQMPPPLPAEPRQENTPPPPPPPPTPWPQGVVPPTASGASGGTPPPTGPGPMPYGASPQFPPTPFAGQSAGFPYSATQPGEAKAIAWLYLAPAIYSVVHSLIAGLSTMCLWIPWLAHFVVAIFGIMKGSKMLSDPREKPSQGLAIAYIAMILDCDPITMTCGIIILVLMNNPRTKAWYGLP